MGGVQGALNATATPKAIALGMEMGFCDMLNPYPMLPPFKGGRISGVTGIPSRRPGDRSRDSVGPGGMYTNYTNTHGPTARRRARTLGLGTAPQSTVGKQR